MIRQCRTQLDVALALLCDDGDVCSGRARAATAVPEPAAAGFLAAGAAGSDESLLERRR